MYKNYQDFKVSLEIIDDIEASLNDCASINDCFTCPYLEQCCNRFDYFVDTTFNFNHCFNYDKYPLPVDTLFN